MILVVAAAFCFLTVSMLGQRLVAGWLKLEGPIRPLAPFRRGVPALHQVAVRLGGVVLTWLLLLTALVYRVSDEAAHDTRVEVLPNSVAARAGLVSGDVVRSIDGVALNDFSELKQAVGLGGVELRLGFERDGVVKEVVVQAPEKHLGVRPLGEKTRPVPWSRVAGDALGYPVRMLGAWPGSGFGLSSVVLSLGWWLTVVLEVLAFGVNGVVRATSARPP